MGRLALAFSLIFCLFLPVSNAGAEQVLTIYFCGTGSTRDGPALDWGGPELISWLYRKDNSDTLPDFHKVIIDGIGTHGAVHNVLDPSLRLPKPARNRGWRECLDEARQALDDILTRHPGESVILNLVGHSRGGVLSMILARWLTDQEDINDPGSDRYEHIQTINILSYDPVPGDDKIKNQDLCLGRRVRRFVGLYAEDERTHKYMPVIPGFDPDRTQAWLVRVPGSHVTLTGNTQTDGHTFSQNWVWDEWCFQELPELCVPYLKEEQDAFLYDISWVAKVIAQALLGSAPWGRVGFASDSDTPEWFRDGKEAIFIKTVERMWDYDYQLMRKSVGGPLLLESYRNEWALGTGCWQIDPVLGAALDRHNQPRCVFRWYCDGSSETLGLNSYHDVLKMTGETAWEKLITLGGLESND